jgi:hypothetical protein
MGLDYLGKGRQSSKSSNSQIDEGHSVNGQIIAKPSMSVKIVFI